MAQPSNAAAPRVLDLTSPQPAFTVVIEHGPAYELVVELCAAGIEGEAGDARRPWWDGVRPTVAPDLVAAVRELDGGNGVVWKVLLGIVHDGGGDHDISALLQALAGMSPDALILQVVEGAFERVDVRPSAALMVGAVRGDAAARAALVHDASRADAALGAWLDRLLSRPADAASARLRALLRRWAAEVFAGEESRVMPLLAADAAARRALAPLTRPDRLVEAATNGIAYTGEPGVLTVVLVPAVALSPWVLIADHGDVRLFCHPVSATPDRGDPAAPPERLLRIAGALGDERRLRILHAVATGADTLPAIADRVGVVKSTAHHHLVLLRDAGLVGVAMGQGSAHGRYVLRAQAAAEVGDLLAGYLGRWS